MHDRCRDRLSSLDTDSSAQQVLGLTCPTSMEAVFFRLLQGVHTISTLFSLQPWMLLAFTSCRHGRAGTEALLRSVVHSMVFEVLVAAGIKTQKAMRHCLTFTASLISGTPYSS